MFSIISVADTSIAPASIVAYKSGVALTDAPVSYSTMAPDNAPAAGVTGQTSLSERIPSLHVPSYGASLTSSIYLRGLGSRIDNPVLALYVDGIPVIDKNMYDFEWLDLASVTLVRGPQGTLYGRNSSAGVLSLRTAAAPREGALRLNASYGSANTISAAIFGGKDKHSLSFAYRHCDGFFDNVYKDEKADPHDALTLRHKYSTGEFENNISVSAVKEGGFAYGAYRDGRVEPVNYNSNSGYRRVSVIEGARLVKRGDKNIWEAAASLQWLSDRMDMDQDYTPQSIFTLRQQRHNGAATAEINFRPAAPKSWWEPFTGFFAMAQCGSLSAPVNFLRQGIEELILDNANAHIPAAIGMLDIQESSFPVYSDFLLYSANAALYHESRFKTGKWTFTAGLRADLEFCGMDYDSRASIHWNLSPTVLEYRQFDISYKGNRTRFAPVLLPKFAIMYRPDDQTAIYALASRGYRGGGYNTQIFSDILQNRMRTGLMRKLGVYIPSADNGLGASHTSYKAEKVWNFEAGGRLRPLSWLGASAALYYLDCRDRQLTVFPPGKNTGRMMSNAGRSRSLGAELEADISSGGFGMILSYAFTDARFVDYRDGDSDYSGNAVPYIPSNTLFAEASYTLDFQGKTVRRLKCSGDLRGCGGIFWDEANEVRQPFYLLAGAAVIAENDRFGFWIRGENLTGTPYTVFWFKSMERQFAQAGKGRQIYLGITIKIK